MRTTACTEAALRILAACAAAGEVPLTMPQMAERLDLTAALVAKACHRMMRAGYLDGVRGRSGGYRLARPAETVSLLEIVELFEDEIDLFPCRLLADGDCRLAAACRLRLVCADAWTAYAGALSGVSVAAIGGTAPPDQT